MAKTFTGRVRLQVEREAEKTLEFFRKLVITSKVRTNTRLNRQNTGI